VSAWACTDSGALRFHGHYSAFQLVSLPVAGVRDSQHQFLGYLRALGRRAGDCHQLVPDGDRGPAADLARLPAEP